MLIFKVYSICTKIQLYGNKFKKKKKCRRIIYQLKNYFNQLSSLLASIVFHCQNRDRKFIIVWQSFDKLCTLVVVVVVVVLYPIKLREH